MKVINLNTWDLGFGSGSFMELQSYEGLAELERSTLKGTHSPGWHIGVGC